MNHSVIEKNSALLGVLIAVVISIGGLVEIVPLALSSESTQPAPGVKPYTALQIEGRDVYLREGCYNCHSQMVRPLRGEAERYGHYSKTPSCRRATASMSAARARSRQKPSPAS